MDISAYNVVLQDELVLRRLKRINTESRDSDAEDAAKSKVKASKQIPALSLSPKAERSLQSRLGPSDCQDVGLGTVEDVSATPTSKMGGPNLPPKRGREVEEDDKPVTSPPKRVLSRASSSSFHFGMLH